MLRPRNAVSVSRAVSGCGAQPAYHARDGGAGLLRDVPPAERNDRYRVTQSERDVIEVAANAAYLDAMDVANADMDVANTDYDAARIKHARAFNAAVATYDATMAATE